MPEQLQAIEDRGRDLFLSAGAGTGKTAVLVERFCRAVCEDRGLGVENVLAFTFTERAAAELKRRIRSELVRRAGETGDPEESRRLRSLARESESAWVSTIHSFCRRILAAQPLSAGLDPGFRVLDEAEAGRAAGEAFDAAFRRFAEHGDDDRFEMAAAFRVSSLRTMVRATHDELRSLGRERPALPELGPPDVNGAIAELRAAAEGALAATEADRGKKVVACRREQMAAALAATERRVPAEEEVAEWRFESKAQALCVPEVERFHVARAELECRLVEDRFAHHYDHLRELLVLYDEEYRRLKDDRSALDFEDLQLGAARLLRERPEVARGYRSQFRHLMVDELQDTNALQLELVRLLHLDREGALTDPAAASGEVPANGLFTVGDELQSIYSFRHADVDVFRAQRERTEAADDALAVVRRLGGNFRSRPEVLALVNRMGRSLFGSAYEALAAGALPEREPGAEPRSEPAVEVLVCERKGWEEREPPGVSADEQAQPWRVAEARFLAERLRALHERGVPRGEMVVLLRSYSYVEAYAGALEDAGLAPHVVGGRGYWSTQQVTDVRNLLACIANPLDDLALLGVLASPACAVSSDALWLLRRAAGSRPTWSALAWLYGPRVEAEPPEGEAPAGDDPPGGHSPGEDRADAGSAARAGWRERAAESARHVPEEDANALRELVATVLELRADAPRHSLEGLIDAAITATGYDLALLARPRGRRRMANVRKLMRLAREFEASAGRDLRAFLDYAAEETESGGREAEAAVDAEGHDGVRVMTVHAAKGLEFPVVAVADLGRGLGAGPGPALRVDLETDPDTGDGEPGGVEEGIPAMRVGLRLARLGKKQRPIFDYPALEREAVEREREEERRILHVAMTRAERHLVLSGSFELAKLAAEPKETDPLIAPVVRALGWDGRAAEIELEPPPLRPGLEGRLPPARVAVRVRTPDEDELQGAGRGASTASERHRPEPGLTPLPDPELAPLAPPAGPPVRGVSYSALALYERCGYRFYAERVLGMRRRLPGVGPSGSDPGPDLTSSDAADRPTDEWHPDGGADDLVTRYARGRAVHELLERSAREGWAVPDREHAAALLRREGAAAGRERAEGALALTRGFLESPLCMEVASAARIHPEAPFAFRTGGLLVRGEIDLLADLGGEVLVIDYKTDALDGSAPAEHLERYRLQRRIYALAALRRYGKAVRVAYVFLERPDDPVEERFEPEDAERLARELAATTGGIVGGRFEVTDAPERPLCLDCPARERLCVHGPELTMRDSAAA